MTIRRIFRSAGTALCRVDVRDALKVSRNVACDNGAASQSRAARDCAREGFSLPFQLVTSLSTPAQYAISTYVSYAARARRTFKLDLTNLYSTFEDKHYDWLPGPSEIPKELGKQLSQEYLDNLQLDRALIDAYEYMQKYAVGLEQIVWDQEDLQLEFHDQFKHTEYKLLSVLCELQVALVERQLSPRPDVQRDIMTSEFRSISSETFRNLRDWVIFRDYMNGLEYVVQVFEHLHRGLQS
ncbi:hypothetical protein K0M31_003680 [Melipona bicolor]|uniref:Uncharacterized protein n=1 Tax=Melipona bicolor TaxID=60889 RepID=A0AA40FXG3_9HYME|nr:hypothetical protein K0M31_003680 [Melipona bicolor]